MDLVYEHRDSCSLMSVESPSSSHGPSDANTVDSLAAARTTARWIEGGHAALLKAPDLRSPLETCNSLSSPAHS
jgi:hypothetical protein